MIATEGLREEKHQGNQEQKIELDTRKDGGVFAIINISCN